MDFDDVTIQKLQIVHGTLFSIKLNSSKVVMFISSWDPSRVSPGL